MKRRVSLSLIRAIICCAMIGGSGATLAKDPSTAPYPADFALHEPSPGKWVWRKFPSLMPVYIYADDTPGKSNCNDGCASAWPPVRAGATAKPIGDWTIVVRKDGSRQWAYKKRPVYLRYHDEVGNPTGDGEDGKWRVLQEE